MELLVYKKFYEQADVQEVTDVLENNGIEYAVTEHRETLDSLYGDKPFSHLYFIKIKGEDFEKADAIISKVSEAAVEAVDENHYLFGFTDDELFEIIAKPDEWSPFDNHLARKILKDRGKEITLEVVTLLRKQRVNDLARPDEGHKLWIAAGYFFSLLGGLIGVFIGWHLSTYTKTLPNGQRVYGYKKEGRNHGRRIWILGAVMFVIYLLIRLSKEE